MSTTQLLTLEEYSEIALWELRGLFTDLRLKETRTGQAVSMTRAEWDKMVVDHFSELTNIEGK